LKTLSKAVFSVVARRCAPPLRGGKPKEKIEDLE
jgi:hypothetical protein